LRVFSIAPYKIKLKVKVIARRKVWKIIWNT